MQANMWDVKSMINKVKNTVMNYTEMEAKVREATNNDAWGASSTLMKELSDATYRYDHFNEILPTIFKRMTDPKSSWRNIYKSLTLLEYLLKNGSEKVLDYSNQHSYDLKSLNNFQFIDEKQKDQGINVRQRSKEIINLIENRELLESEREKAKINRNKYIGVSNDGRGSPEPFSHDRSSHNQSPNSFSHHMMSRKEIESNYNDNSQPPSSIMASSSYDSRPSSPPQRSSTAQMPTAKPVSVQTKPQEELLLDFGSTENNSNKKTNGFDQNDDFADFADFQSAFPQPSGSTKPVPLSQPKQAQPQMDLFSSFTDFNEKSSNNSAANYQISSGTTANNNSSFFADFGSAQPNSASSPMKPQNSSMSTMQKQTTVGSTFASLNPNLVDLSSLTSSTSTRNGQGNPMYK